MAGDHRRPAGGGHRRYADLPDTADDFDFDRDMARLADLPRQAEWEAYVAQFQGCAADASSADKWQMMERIF